MELAKDEKLAFEPGTSWRYSNTGMLVLGKVIEVVTKQDYFDYVREHLYKPAGMVNTDAYQLDQVNRNLAVGYDKQFHADGTKWFRNNIFMHVIRGGPAGGGYSTAEDLVTFAGALQSGKLVSPATFELLTTPKPDVHSSEYGYGFSVDPESRVVIMRRADEPGRDPTDLLAEINGQLEGMHSDGTLTRLSQRRFGGADLTAP